MSEPPPIWRQETCELCKALVPMCCGCVQNGKRNHKTLYYCKPCTAPTETEYIAELTARVAELEKDKALIDWLQSETVDVIYLDDRRIIDVRGGDVRKSLIDAMNQAAQGKVTK